MCLAAGLLTACKDNKKGEAQSEKRTEMEQRAQEFLANAHKSFYLMHVSRWRKKISLPHAKA